MVCRVPEIPPSRGFVLEQKSLDLWVMDIPFEPSGSLNEQFRDILEYLLENEETLRNVGRGYENFALNIEFSLPIQLASLPLSLIDLASRCGFEIGIISDQMAEYC